MDDTKSTAQPSASATAAASVPRRSDWAIAGALVASCAIAYWPVRHAGFISLDDPDYVGNNAVVQRGLTWEGVTWAFTTGHMSNWHPLTWLSHMLDCSIFGLNSGAMHVENVSLHAMNAVLMFWLMRRLTGKVAQSGFAGALFALHPAHVESVAWVSERKDVLSTLFWLLTSLAYVRWVEAPTRKRYAWIVGLLTLGLLCKPMLVTLPLTLIVLDYWPLSRLGAGARLSWRRSVLEKVPLLAVALGSAVVTFLVQWHGGAVASIAQVGIGYRLVNAVVAYGRYLGEFAWPTRLGAFYPLPGAWPATWVAASTLSIAAISTIAWASRKRRPYLLAGWLFFAGTLVPVLGLVQVGSQSMADRYTYVPYVGLSMMVVWAGGELADRLGRGRMIVLIPGIVVIAALLVATQRQARLWIDNETLFRHTLAIGGVFNVYANYQVGVALLKRGEVGKAKEHFAQILARDPGNEYGHAGMGTVVAQEGHPDDAARHFEQVLRVEPNNVDCRRNLAQILADKGQDAEALSHFERVLAAVPGDAISHRRVGRILAKRGDLPGAIVHLDAAVEASPDDQSSRLLLATLLTRQRRTDEAVPQWVELRRRANDSAPDLIKLGTSLASLGLFDPAADALDRALSLDPSDARGQVTFATVELIRNHEENALLHFAEARRLRPEDPALLMRSGEALAGSGKVEEAVPYLLQAVALDDSMTSRYLEVVRGCARVNQRHGAELLLRSLSAEAARWRGSGKQEQASRAERDVLRTVEELGLAKGSGANSGTSKAEGGGR